MQGRITPDNDNNVDRTPNNDAESSLQAQQLLKLANYRMPFGKYKGQLLIDLPEPYVVWFAKQGFPKGELGEMLRSLYEIEVNGLRDLLKPIRRF